MNRRWARWADARASAYKREHSVSVAPIWLYGRTPWLAVRMWLSERVRLDGGMAVERVATMIWPGER